MAGTVGIGLAALGRPAYITSGRERDLGDVRSIDDMRGRTARVLDAAYSSGVRYIDCARSYGYAEAFLADWLSSRPEITDVTVASKWGYRYVGDWRRDADVHEIKDHSAAALTEQWQATSELLAGRLAIYQVHSLMPDDPLFDDGAAIDRLATLRAGGVAVGFSTSGPHQADTVRRAMDIDREGQPLFTVVQSTWNVLETAVGPALAEAHDAGLTIVVKEAMANGRLAPGNTDDSPGADAVRTIAKAAGVGEDAVALATALAQPWTTHVLSGAVTLEQLHANLAAADLTLGVEQLGELTAAPDDAERYWRRRSERRWA